MLALTIKDGEVLHIGDDIKIILQKGKGGTKVAVDAPKDIKVLREKLKSWH
ncbi:carbon storage regulator [Marinobacterium sp. xm-d-543]|uniref:carbon storage regulator n=1 Tax=Marinobacterium sp. xm-d-543 TaxID=2497740 RepID=UPI001567DF81|nr:carbon storage regulator [Marinobacterium sp. xm-d-543]NRP47549.1 carbon storage regulator [Marinobacterium sp. xm-d-543]